jgi:hypothetical protein
MLNKEICRHCNKKNQPSWESFFDAQFDRMWAKNRVNCPLGSHTIDVQPEKCMFTLEHVLAEQAC